MLQLVPLVALVSLSVTTINQSSALHHDYALHSSTVMHTPGVPSSSLAAFFPRFLNPFASRKAKPAKVHTRQPIELMERRLRDLVGQQESWYAKEGRYGHNAYRAGQLRKGDSTAFEDVQVEILFAGKTGWTALASHPAAPGLTCVVFVGFRERLPLIPRTHNDGKEATLEGIPACDKR